jgi:hypothetical protein
LGKFENVRIKIIQRSAENKIIHLMLLYEGVGIKEQKRHYRRKITRAVSRLRWSHIFAYNCILAS